MKELDDVFFFKGWGKELMKIFRKLPANRQEQVLRMVGWVGDESKPLEARKSGARGIYNMARNWMKGAKQNEINKKRF